MAALIRRRLVYPCSFISCSSRRPFRCRLPCRPGARRSPLSMAKWPGCIPCPASTACSWPWWRSGRRCLRCCLGHHHAGYRGLDRQEPFRSELAGLGVPQVEAFIRDARAIAFGGVVGFTDATKEAAAAAYRSIHATSIWIIIGIMTILAVGGFLLSYRKIAPAFRARHVVERIVQHFSDPVLRRRHSDHARHRPVPDLRIAALLPGRCRSTSFCSARIGAHKAPSPARAPRLAPSTPTFSASSRFSPARC